MTSGGVYHDRASGVCACGIADSGYGTLKAFDGKSLACAHCQGHAVAGDPDLQQLRVSPAGVRDRSAFAVSVDDLPIGVTLRL